MDGDREVANVSLLTGAAIEWNEDRNKRIVYQVTPAEGGWNLVRQISTDELLSALVAESVLSTRCTVEGEPWMIKRRNPPRYCRAGSQLMSRFCLKRKHWGSGPTFHVLN
ncbi:acriflavin resistance protein [Granulicella mallensis MP5ACTX8]|uniref:Acriflavin resistance protein n=1 Tax=Granulicella mallensis (strain ATCC BAA-1857 / DSM 23137 / MP5ACTX8) TaxID=682795 RepID=G8NS57_GRAMM|nr:acriflavin resistance protein [Granulicella mallensis MP5ACTX8]